MVKTVARVLLMVLLAVAGGTAMAVAWLLGGAVVHPDQITLLPEAIMVGAVLGHLSSAVVVPALWRKRFDQIALWVYLPCLTVAAATGPFAAPEPTFALLALVLIASVGICFVRLRSTVEVRYAGECLVCGYNLRGNSSGLCPECGTSIGSTTRERKSAPPSLPPNAANGVQ